MVNPTFALGASLIWAFSPIYYRAFLKRFDFLVLNLTRTALASAVLFLPAIYFGFGGGTGYALLSGSITLAVGDSLFLLSIKEMGASVATPVVYTYVLLVQLTAGEVGESVPLVNLVSALLVVAGVFALSRSGSGSPRARGLALALAAAVVWAVGQDLIGLATAAGGSAVSIAFSRNMAAAVALAAAALATRKGRRWPSGLTLREFALVAAIAISDLAVGSLLYVYSASLAGVATTVILTSPSPALTQVLSKALGKESPRRTDFLGGGLIVAAVVLAVAL
jgi:DME family drug/metabolite transporter